MSYWLTLALVATWILCISAALYFAGSLTGQAPLAKRWHSIALAALAFCVASVLMATVLGLSGA